MKNTMIKKPNGSELAVLGGTPTITESGPHYVWPIITDSTRSAVMQQLDTATSIKNCSGIIKEFEEKVANYYGAKYCLLNNSGTMSIFSMLDAIQLKPGDEIICPNYTWFATISPLLYLGATPIFCDCDVNGNIDPEEAEKLITERTCAVIVTHMWGMPCQISKFVNLCNKYNLRLLEDSSHAHGAVYKGEIMGVMGDAAAWSLQSSKLISGGEGGIILTNDEDIYARVQLTGHYNKRCKQHVPENHEMREFWQTGFGLKLRAHPLGIAMANEQFDNLDIWLMQKRSYATEIIKSLEDIPFLTFPKEDDCQSSWYSLVIRYNENNANGVSRKVFYDALIAEGLLDLDIPGLTGPISHLPVFQNMNKAMPRWYLNHKEKGPDKSEFPMSWKIANEIITMPVWSLSTSEYMVDKYIEGIRKVSDAIINKVLN